MHTGGVVICTTIVIYVQLGGRDHATSHAIFPSIFLTLTVLIPTSARESSKSRLATPALSASPFQIWLQLAHRFVAVIIAAGVVTCLFLARKTGEYAGRLSRFTDLWFLLLACQITLGAWVIWSNKAADIATAHVAVGATMFAIGVTLSALCLRIARNTGPAMDAQRSAIPLEVPVS